MTKRLEFSAKVRDQAAQRANCDIFGCASPWRGYAGQKQVCGAHYQRWKKYGSFDLPERRMSCDGICLAPGCDRAVRSRGCAYCETHYYRVRRNSREGLTIIGREKVCARCGETHNRPQSDYCSHKCKWRAGRTTPDTRNCVQCGLSFVVSSKAITCSAECSKKHAAETSKKSTSAWRSTERGKESIRNRELRRRALKYNAPAEQFSRSEILARDGWICGLCRRSIPKSAKWPSRKFGTIDHIIPLSKGGSHTRINVQAAHLGCNCAKNSSVIGQLRLFG